MSDLFQFLLCMGDNSLVLGHHVSEWCGVAPVLEEDIALANTALDLIGQTQLWLGLAAEVESKGRDADALAPRRDVWDLRNLLMVEQPNRDFGHTMMRPAFDLRINDVFSQATLTKPDTHFAHQGGKTGKLHSEHLGHMLAAMQFLPRAYPDAKWCMINLQLPRCGRGSIRCQILRFQSYHWST